MLRWNDIDFKNDTILWRAEADKKRREWKVPVPPGVARGVAIFFAQSLEARLVGFSSHRNLTQRFRSDETCLPNGFNKQKVFAATGGWRDVATLLRRYQQPDEATMLPVMSHPREILDRVSGIN
jgi:integrase